MFGGGPEHGGLSLTWAEISDLVKQSGFCCHRNVFNIFQVFTSDQPPAINYTPHSVGL